MKKYPTPHEREGILAARRDAKMAGSAHAYVRGNTEKFYEWLDAVKPGSLPAGVPIWICGDCHSGNLGPIGAANGEVDIGIRDLDQTVIGNPAHDLIRLGLSLATSVRDSDLPGVTTVTMIEQMVTAYTASLSSREPSRNMPKCVGKTLRQALGRRWKHLAEEQIKDTLPTIPLGKRFWPLAAKESRALRAVVESETIRDLATLLRTREDDASVRMLDAAYWMKGCSSLGRLRIAVLVGVGEAPYDGKSLCLLDVKEAIPAAAPHHTKAFMPTGNAVRVITGARHLSPALGERMRAAELMGREVFIRELLPQDLKIEIDRLTATEAIEVARCLSEVIGRAHAAQMDAATRREWQRHLARARSKTIDAPPWFWRSVVDLIGIHETAYLDHCRRVGGGHGQS